MINSDHLFEFCGAPYGLLCSFPGLYLFVQTRRTFNLLHWALSSMSSLGKKWVTVTAICNFRSRRQLAPLNKSPLSGVPTGGAVCPTGAHTGLTFLNFFPETNGLCWGTAAGKEGKKKKALFYYSKVHFNLHKRHCVCDGLHEGKHYSPASSVRKK